MLDQVNIEKVLFLDIETVSQYPEYEMLPEEIKKLWDHKAQRIVAADQGETAGNQYERAGIYAEFGRIICISVGFIRNGKLRIKSFYGDDEALLLNDFADLLNQSFSKPDILLCAHNGKEFDFPYIARRMLINGIRLPALLDIAGRKPWEVQHLDTMELWKFGDYKSYTSLALLTMVFNIPTPKDDIDGSQVGSVYWKEKNLPRIVEYCQKDVVAVVQLLLRYKGKPLIEAADIVFT
ncbi:predicted 3'-5' exonuclease related to the exonuclease domain of PolB [Lentimicrobium saccharophilum]|uniref:Predicted 3'-5' exonuclease related to the exonuclease domain of PolB n=1 Tax=Lentimicrobium saccharophilum TaxID=1678841 RepID=A0A0S7C1D6_9BACT|nr:3'-5' exonuclease [Lentimicrobium saccharophilum]GAP42760.1 predicted 3'-5' exonuclease related to the exonuclease domain of PolB [Lentimicrobium saccharophilum]